MDTSNRQSSQLTAYPGMSPGDSVALAPDDARTVFGQVMGLVALTLGFLALGAFIGRNLSGGLGILFFIGSFAAIFGLNIASSRGREQLATTLLFGLGLLLGLGLGPVLNSYASADPSAIWQAAGATGAFVAILGAAGYATRRDLPRGRASCSWRCSRSSPSDWSRSSSRSRTRTYLGSRRARDLRRIHNPRLQPTPPHRRGQRRPDRSEHLPRRRKRVPVLPRTVRWT